MPTLNFSKKSLHYKKDIKINVFCYYVRHIYNPIINAIGQKCDKRRSSEPSKRMDIMTGEKFSFLTCNSFAGQFEGGNEKGSIVIKARYNFYFIRKHKNMM